MTPDVECEGRAAAIDANFARRKAVLGVNVRTTRITSYKNYHGGTLQQGKYGTGNILLLVKRRPMDPEELGKPPPMRSVD